MEELGIVVVFSSWGRVEADPNTGKPTQFDLVEGATVEQAFTGEITRFDFEEWKKTYSADLPYCLDILDVGYWVARPDGEEVYEKPDKTHRQMILDGGAAIIATSSPGDEIIH